MFKLKTPVCPRCHEDSCLAVQVLADAPILLLQQLERPGMLTEGLK
jgi:hypothetical protein